MASVWVKTQWCARAPSEAKNWTGVHAAQRNGCVSVLTGEVPRLRDERGFSSKPTDDVDGVDGTLEVCSGAGPCVDDSRSDGGAAMRGGADGAMSDGLMPGPTLCRFTEYDDDPNEGRPP